jgi:hypothetical protein
MTEPIVPTATMRCRSDPAFGKSSPEHTAEPGPATLAARLAPGVPLMNQPRNAKPAEAVAPVVTPELVRQVCMIGEMLAAWAIYDGFDVLTKIRL